MANQLRRVNGLYERVLNIGHGDEHYKLVCQPGTHDEHSQLAALTLETRIRWSVSC